LRKQRKQGTGDYLKHKLNTLNASLGGGCAPQYLNQMLQRNKMEMDNKLKKLRSVLESKKDSVSSYNKPVLPTSQSMAMLAQRVSSAKVKEPRKQNLNTIDYGRNDRDSN